MSYSKFYIVAISLSCATGSALAASVECPRTLFGKSLTATDVYDGPVLEMASLVPPNGGWKLAYPAWSKEGFYLACHYVDTILSFLIPTDVNGCWFTADLRTVCNRKTKP